MQFKIPQDVQRADTIIGPITFAQLGITLVGGAIDYAIYISLARDYYWYVWAPPVVIIGAITLAFAFLKINDMTFTRFLVYFYEYLFKPRDRVWKKEGEYYYSVLKPAINVSKLPDLVVSSSDEELRAKREKLKEISKILDQ
jgi:hypothetical protein